MTRPIGFVTLGAVALLAVLQSGCGGDDNGGGSSTPTLTGYQIVTGSTSSASGNAISAATASCPSSKVVIGGGYTTGAQAANVHDSFPASGGTGWTVGIKNEDINVTTSITWSPVAVCVDKPAGYEIRDQVITLSSNQRASASASCTDQTLTLVGGGYRSGDPIVTNFATSFDPSVVSGTTVGSTPTTWVSTFHSNHPIAASSSAHSFAICVANSAVSTAYLASATSTIGTQSRSTLTQGCDSTSPQTMVSSGGVESDVSPAVTFDSTPSSTSWTAGVHNTATLVLGLSAKSRILLVCVAATA